MHKIIRATIFFLLLLTVPAYAWEARVVAVADGDTVTVEPAQGGERVRIRLYGIDCPESRQPYGQVARDFVIKAALYRAVEIDTRDTDRYGRTVAVVVLPGGGNLQEALLSAGLAWVYPQYCKRCDDWKALQGKAKADEVGLWQDGDPVQPWVWRKNQKGR